MQPAEAKQIPTEQAIFNNSWAIVKKYYNISQTSNDAEWKALIDEANKLYKIGINKPTKALSKAFALGVIEYLDILSKEREQAAKRTAATDNL